MSKNEEAKELLEQVLKIYKSGPVIEESKAQKAAECMEKYQQLLAGSTDSIRKSIMKDNEKLVKDIGSRIAYGAVYKQPIEAANLIWLSEQFPFKKDPEFEWEKIANQINQIARNGAAIINKLAAENAAHKKDRTVFRQSGAMRKYAEVDLTNEFTTKFGIAKLDKFVRLLCVYYQVTSSVEWLEGGKRIDTFTGSAKKGLYPDGVDAVPETMVDERVNAIKLVPDHDEMLEFLTKSIEPCNKRVVIGNESVFIEIENYYENRLMKHVSIYEII